MIFFARYFSYQALLQTAGFQLESAMYLRLDTNLDPSFVYSRKIY